MIGIGIQIHKIPEIKDIVKHPDRTTSCLLLFLRAISHKSQPFPTGAAQTIFQRFDFNYLD
jgi:hypothetical protein